MTSQEKIMTDESIERGERYFELTMWGRQQRTGRKNRMQMTLLLQWLLPLQLLPGTVMGQADDDVSH